MKKLLILSDSHGKSNYNEIIENEKFDYVIHCGDSQFPYDSLELSNIDLKVKGNCDFDSKFELEIMKEIENIGLVYVLHGHTKGVNFGINELKNYCIDKGVSLCLYGHTHVLYVDYDITNDLLIINPGSTTQSRSKYPCTYVTLCYDNTKYNVCVKSMDDNKIIYEQEYKRKEEI